MDLLRFKIQPLPSLLPFQNPKHNRHSIKFTPSRSPLLFDISRTVSNPRHHHRRQIIKTCCITPVDEIALPSQDTDPIQEQQQQEEEADADDEIGTSFSGNEEHLWKQMKEIVLFAGPAVGLWICGPLMSLIDTAVIGQGSSLELAALGPGTVVCDNASYVFMFLSIATSNMVATSLAREGQKEVQHKISMLLFVGLTCGVGMLLLTKVFGVQILAAFTGTKNLHIVPAANTYVQIRGLAWPAILVGWVAQSASLGMKDSWGPLKALVVASAVNAIGDIVLCCYLGYGIAGAAWATMVSQVVAAFMMMESLNKKGFNAYSVSIPSPKELQKVFELAAPVFITMVSKVAFYSLLTYFATSMGTITMAAHQVMIQVYCMCTVWGEPLSQTAQSFMPELIFGINRSLKKARMLLKSLVIIGAITGSVLGIIGTTVPWVFPKLFTADNAVVGEAGQDLRFLSFSMSGCFTLGGLLVLLVSSKGCGLSGCWWGLAGFQWARFLIALTRLTSRDGLLYSEEFSQRQMERLKTV